MKVRTLALAASAASAIAAAPTALAGTVDIGGGWSAAWDDSLDGFVDIAVNDVRADLDAVFIEKFAIFTQGSVNGQFPTIAVTFTQTSADAVGNIVIDDEIITNSTGEDWGGFRMQLIGGGNPTFDTAMTAASGGGGPIGFSINPFTTASYSDNDQRVDFGGGTVVDGAQWLPGSGAEDGQLWINVDTGDGINTPFTIFTLKETPVVPGPAAIAGLGIGLLFSRRRRK